MLRITKSTVTDEVARLVLEGKVIGPWVDEVQKCCEELLGNGRQLTLDFAEVSFVSRDGIILLQDLAKRQVTLINCSSFLTEQLKQMAK